MRNCASGNPEIPGLRQKAHPGMTVLNSRRYQTNWSIRVPCPGGSGAGAGGWAAPASLASLSLLAGGVVVWLVVT